MTDDINNTFIKKCLIYRVDFRKIKIKNMIKKIFKKIIILLILLLLFNFIINIYVLSFYKTKINYNIDNIKYNKVWLVFWARVLPNKRVSNILKDRLDWAIMAYKTKKISKIIVSWDNWFKHYNEPEIMQEYLVSKWVLKKDIYLDYAGFDTYDSIYRANYIFWIKQITLFTQEYHLKRAIYIADRLWIDTIWFATDFRKYKYIKHYNAREILSRIKAFLDSDILKSNPKFLGDKIFIK